MSAKEKQEQIEQEVVDPCIVPKEWNIWQRMNWVRGQTYYVKKDAQVQGYMGVTHDAVTASLHDVIVKAGIIVFPTLIESSIEVVGQTKNNTPIIRYAGLYDVVFINAVRPDDSYSIRTEAHANDQGDKAPGKACSYAQKTAILKVFFMETGINDEGRIDAMQAAVAPVISEDQSNELYAMLDDNGIERDKFLSWLRKSLKVGSIEEIRQTAYDQVKHQIEASIKARAGK